MTAIHDPYSLGKEVLDNTPWFKPGFDNRRGTERSLGFCNPFGYEDDNPRVLGGTRRPENESYQWQCRNYAQARYWMTCVNGHRGRVTLCYGHVWQIEQRMSGLCPRCSQPPRARELEEKAHRIMADLHPDSGLWPDQRQRLASVLADIQAEMDELRRRGIISTGAPLRLTEVS